ncbi:MAG: cysteine desulfurase [Methanocorpusculum parvum]|nr:cysteine desulfurase [Methanocorpusculum parvum]
MPEQEPDWETLRGEFPMMGDLIYFDNGATTWSPECVLGAMNEFERTYRANVGRGVHRLTRIATQKYWHAHEKVAEFINGNAGTTVFVKNTTEAINTIARGFPFKKGDVVVTTILEHHSDLLPWRALEKQGVELRVVGLNDDLTLDMKAFKEAMDDSVRLVAVTHASNVTGTITPIAEISAICKKYGALLSVDAAQSIPRMPIDVEALGIDFLSFSGHKMFGPMGTGVLWMRKPILEPLCLGGGMVESVSDDDFVPAKGYQKYEAGTPNVSGGIGLGAAVDFLSNIGMKHVEARERKLTDLLIDGLTGIPGVTLYSCKNPESRIGVVSFTVDGFEPHEIAEWLDDEHGIAIRSGMHCAEPLMHYLGAEKGTARACISFYNTESEVKTLAAMIKELIGR